MQSRFRVPAPICQLKTSRGELNSQLPPPPLHPSCENCRVQQTVCGYLLLAPPRTVVVLFRKMHWKSWPPPPLLQSDRRRVAVPLARETDFVTLLLLRFRKRCQSYPQKMDRLMCTLRILNCGPLDGLFFCTCCSRRQKPRFAPCLLSHFCTYLFSQTKSSKKGLCCCTYRPTKVASCQERR